MNWKGFKNMMGALSPDGMKAKVLLQVQEMVGPMLQDMMKTINRPRAQGGLLTEGDYGACFAVVPVKEKSVPMIITLRFDHQSGNMIIANKIPISELENALTHGAEHAGPGGADEEE